MGLKNNDVLDRLLKQVPPKIGLRVIPEPLFQNRLGPSERLYVCIGDYQELQGLTLAVILGRLFERVSQSDEGRLTQIFGKWINTSAGTCVETDYASMKRYERFYVVLIDLSDADALDLFPGTWKSMAYIVSDPERMEQHPNIYQQFMRIVQGEKPFQGLLKSEIDFYELGALENESNQVNPQFRYYSYLTTNSLFGSTIVGLFGIHNRCWHGRGYTGSDGTVASRVFFVRNSDIDHPSVLSCRLMHRHEIVE